MIVWYKLVISVIICLAIGSLSGLFTKTSPDSWYGKIIKPSFNPPNYIFAPVWTILYILMGIALYFLWQSNSKTAIIFFIIQLILNFAWSYIFFRLESPLFALIEILILLVFIILTMIYAYPSPATYLLIPYVLWVSFATLLTFEIFRLNS